MKTPEWLLEGWNREFLQILEMMTAENFSASLSQTPTVALGDLGWWQQSLSLGPGAELYVGTTRAAAVELGRRLLQAAGVDSIDDDSALSTYEELLQQSTSGLARSIGKRIGKTVDCTSSGSSALPSDAALSFLILSVPDFQMGPIALGVSGSLIALLADTKPAAASTLPANVPKPQLPASTDPVPPPVASAQPSTLRNVDVLLDVEMPVSLCFGQATLRLKEVLELTNGSIVELNRQPEEPVEIVVNNCVIARGEVVVIDGNYGVRIQQIISRQERWGLRPESN
jgi:flagellar motor switch protein FliN/FliY